MTADPGSFQPLTPNTTGTTAWGTAMWSAPELWNTPSLFATAALSDNPSVAAQGLAHVNQQVQFQQVAKQEHHSGFWGSVFHHVAGGTMKVLDYAAKPLEDIQHEYRYVKTAFSHGNFWVGAGMIAAFAAGTFVGGPLAGMIAAEAIGELGRTDTKTWDYSQTHGGSFGRDIAHGLGMQNTDHGWGKVVSGLGDGLFDTVTDPLIKLGKISALRNSEEGFIAGRTSILAKTLQRNATTNAFLNRLGPGLSMRTPDQIDQAYRVNGRYKRAAKDIAGITDRGTLIARFPEFQNLTDNTGRSALDELVAARHPDQVNEVFKGIAFDTEWQQRIHSGMLPSRSLMRIGATRLSEKLRGDVARDSEARFLTPSVRRFTDANGDAQKAWQLPALLKPVAMSGGRPWYANLQGAASRTIRTFSGYQPYSIEKGTAKLTGTFSYEDDRDLQGLLRSMRYAMGERTARQKLGEYVGLRLPGGAADIAGRKAWWGETQAEILKAAGFPDDPEAYAHLVQKARALVHGPMHQTSYGAGHTLGDEVNQVVDKDTGIMQRLAGQGWQATEQGAYPDFRVLTSTIRKLHTYSNLYGRIDDMAAKFYTEGYFKPLSLVGTGFGLRVASAELLPAFMRYGAWNMLRSRVATSAAQGQFRLETGQKIAADRLATKIVNRAGLKSAEIDHLTWASAKAAGGLQKLMRMDKEKRDLIVRSVYEGGGHTAHGVASAGDSGWSAQDNATQNAHYLMDQAVKRHGRLFWKGSGNFYAFGPDEPHFAEMWHYNAVRTSREPSTQLIAQDFKRELARTGDADQAAAHATQRETQRIKGIDPDTGLVYGPAGSGVRDPYGLERQKLGRYSIQDPAVQALHRVDSLRGLFTGRDETVHDWLLDKFANGDNAISEGKLHAVDPAHRPKQVAGEVPEPFIGPNVYQRAVQGGFVRLVDPVINYLSRDPIYTAEFLNQYHALKPAIEHSVLPEETAFRVARERTARAMVPQVHNTQIRSQFHLMVKNLLPFWFAQEQALKRAGHLIRRNPAAFREYQLVQHAISNPGFINTDDQGNQHLLLPGLGELGVASNAALSLLGMAPVGGLSMSVTGDMQSLKTVLPDFQNPSTSPLLAISLSKLANIDPAFAPIVKGITGDRGYNESLTQGLIPNTALRNLAHGLFAMEGDPSFANAMMSAAQMAAYHGHLPPADDPVAQQAWMDRLKNNGRSIFFVKAILSAFSPLTPAVEETDYGLRDEFYKLVKKKGNYVAALNAFTKLHGNKAISYTVARSNSATGANIPVAQPAVDFITQHPSLIAKHPWGAAFITPQADGKGDSQVLYSELLRDHLRQRETPTEFLKSIYSMTGTQIWTREYRAHEDRLKAVAGNTAAEEAERTTFGLWQKETFATTNPIAYDYLFSQDKQTNAKLAYNDIAEMFNRGEAPVNEQSRMVYTLTQDYERHRAAIAALGADRNNGHNRQLERDAWSKYLTDLAQRQPLLEPVINAVFARLETVE